MAGGPAAWLPFQKKSLHASERERPDVVEAREAWTQGLAEIDPRRLIFLDESNAKTNMTRLYGWAEGGERVVDHTPLRRWHSTTMLAAIRVDGVIPEACATYEGGTTGEVFRFYVEDMLAPQLRPGDVVVMDNLSSHKVAGIREAIEARGAELCYLPAYSPDLNPIEPMGSKVKTLLRKAKARCEDTLHDAIGQALRAVTATDLRGFYADAGYATSE